MKQTISYYVNRGSHAFVCFVDFSKAFDKVKYWKLFNQLLDDGIPIGIVNLLAYWYSHQELASISWHGHDNDMLNRWVLLLEMVLNKEELCLHICLLVTLSIY